MAARVGSLFRTKDLGGGFRLHFHRTRAFKTLGARLVLHADLDRRTAARALVPRILGRGTRRHPSLRELQIAFDQLYGAHLGGEARKMGERHLVVVRAEWVHDRIAGEALSRKVADLLRDFLHEPATDADGGLRAAVFEQERKNMADEAAAVFDDKARYARHQLITRMCRGEAYARPALGHLEEIRALTLEEVRRAHRDLLDRAPADLFLVGEMTWAQALGFARRLGFDHTRRVARLRPTLLRRAGHVRTITERQKVGQAKLEMGFRTDVRLSERLYPGLVVMNALFGGTPVGKLFKIVRERESLCYSIGTAVERTKGILLLHAGVDGAKAGKARRLILQQLDALRAGDVAPEEIDKVREMLGSSLRALRDSPGALCDFALERHVNGVKPDLDLLLRGIERAKVRDVTEAARRVHLDTVYLLKD